MEEDFYRGRLQEEHGIPVLLPDAEERALVRQVIYQELCLGTVRDESRAAYWDIIRRLVERGAEGIILGCTEIGMLVTAADAPVPLFDTTEIHARAAVDRALLDIT
ncbi:aspartate/glutamate racemase family protein [Microbulbifer rhizosphaerae]|uniref:Aspartate racemase n=1 Tax=Microbulbifer rhizosphaerae TaxID=1562603 RepID=A0A7W4WFE5_9GAMM|nr:aspartate/glutamate racemase family protein [Microbulbifer rhizosphaerae]MBB3062663.1 aspartate racemase [Microbulbifer rhizosphaerae]